MAHGIRLVQKLMGILPQSQGPEDVVFISIDCEAHEHDQNKITEIGVAVLDTRSLIAPESYEECESVWLELIKSQHYRPVEYRRIRNSRWVHGCPDHFNFGVSTWVNLCDVPPLLTRIFQDPTRIEHAADFEQEIDNAERNIVLVGHSLEGDVKYLNRLGFVPEDVLTGQLAFVDTDRIARSGRNQLALARLLNSVRLSPTNLHNAGNDATYTLQALVLMALRESAQPGSMHANVRNAIKPMPVHQEVNARKVYGGTAKRQPWRKPSSSAPQTDKQKGYRRNQTIASDWIPVDLGLEPRLKSLQTTQHRRRSDTSREPTAQLEQCILDTIAAEETVNQGLSNESAAP